MTSLAERVADANAKLDLAHETITELAKTYPNSWRFSFPANHETDTDLIVCDGIRAGKDIIREQAERITALEAKAEKLQRFKDWVHTFLDGKDVPHHPPGTHGAAGCRIGDRMDWVYAERDALIASGLVRGTTPTSIRKRRGASVTPGDALFGLAGDDADGRKADC